MGKILVIDDDFYIRSGCAKILAKEGLEALCVEDGNSGMRELKNNPAGFDLILLDLLMPGMNGMAVLAQIQALDPSLPVIIMTGSATESSIAEITQRGAFACIPKPFTPDEFRAVVREALQNNARW
jgi:DNA-binding NtrC family response regulator